MFGGMVDMDFSVVVVVVFRCFLLLSWLRALVEVGSAGRFDSC